MHEVVRFITTDHRFRDVFQREEIAGLPFDPRVIRGPHTSRQCHDRTIVGLQKSFNQGRADEPTGPGDEDFLHGEEDTNLPST